MAAWLVPALLALAVWSVQRAISKAALATLSTPQLYTLTAVISLPIYLPTLLFDPPLVSAFPPALGLSAMMAVTFGVTTEAIRRGPVGRVSPITGLSPALTAVLAATILDEQMTLTAALGVATAVLAVVLLGYQPQRERTEGGWLWLTIASLVLQGLGAFLAKVVVTPSGPSALLVTSAATQVAVGIHAASAEALVPSRHPSAPDAMDGARARARSARHDRLPLGALDRSGSCDRAVGSHEPGARRIDRCRDAARVASSLPVRRGRLGIGRSRAPGTTGLAATGLEASSGRLLPRCSGDVGGAAPRGELCARRGLSLGEAVLYLAQRRRR